MILDKSQGFTLSKHIGVNMKPSKKNSVRKPSIKKSGKIKVQQNVEQPPKSDQNKRGLKVEEDCMSVLSEYRFKENVLEDFNKYELQYLSEISELFGYFEEEFYPGYMLTDTDPVEITSLQLPYFRVFLSRGIRSLGEEKLIDDGCYEVEDILKSATLYTFSFFSDEQIGSKRERYFIKESKKSYRDAISQYAWFDFRFKKMLESLEIETNSKEI